MVRPARGYRLRTSSCWHLRKGNFPMWPPTITPCECTEPGFCARHQCRKPAAWHLLCRRQMKYFQSWEDGRGPYLPGEITPPSESDDEAIDPSAETDGEPPQGPGLARRAWNFGQAVVRHVADGGREVDAATVESRLAICRACPECDIEHLVCRHKSCGCFLQTKACWQSEKCPLQKWPAVIGEPSDTPSPRSL